MYRGLTPKQSERRRLKLEAMKRGRERAAMARTPRGRPPELPHLRRMVVVTDYDTGEPISHELKLFRSGRVDCYVAEADGQPRAGRVGWSKALAWVRRAYQRVPGKRSDFWW